MKLTTYLFPFVFAFCFSVTSYAQVNTTPGALKPSFENENVKSPDSKISFEYGAFVNKPYVADKHIQITSVTEHGLPKLFSSSAKMPGVGTWEEKAEQWLSKHNLMMKVDSPESFVVKNISTDEIGMTHIKMHQYHQGVKVFDGEIILHAREGSIFLQNGNYVPAEKLTATLNNKISTSVAKSAIIADLENYKEEWNPMAEMGIGKDRKQWEGELVYYNHNGTYVLAYNYIVFANLAERYEYLVDADSGEILNHWPLMCNFHGDLHRGHIHHSHDGSCNHAPEHTPAVKSEKIPAAVVAGPTQANAIDLLGANRTINTYEENGTYFLIDASRSMYRAGASDIPEEPIGAIWTIDIGGQSPVNSNATFDQVASGNNSWGNSREGVSAHFNAGKAYEYFETVHSRTGITGDGQTIVSVVNVTDEDGSSLGNAFYNSLAIWYGNGDNTFFPLGRGLDVAGHELSHGVVANSANLIYQNESGAMNESFADIFGAMIDRDDWKIGEDVMRPGTFPGGALRDMQDPHNGAPFQDLGRGWQPKHMNERFTGSEDNGGVHINSGIPNHAYYRFAEAVGKDRAEKVFYRALTQYLTRSSGFNDLRYAVEQSARDLYNQDVVNSAGQAFSAVGIGMATEPDYETDIDVNGGSDLLLHSDLEKNNLYVANLNTGNLVFNPLSTIPQFSRPSVRDDGSQIIFVDNNGIVQLINIDWSTNPPQRQEISLEDLFGGGWYNAVISKDGNRVALIKDAEVNEIVIYDDILGTSRTYELYNPSFSNDGLQTGEVRFADAMEFDHTGNILMYDALNSVQSGSTSNNIEYWDIGFLQIWNQPANTWGSGKIDKLFGSLPENISIGNATFSKNSPHIIAFDVREETVQGDYEFSVLGMNIETNKRNLILGNNTFSYPNYSRDDKIMVVDFSDGSGSPSFPDVKGIGRLGIGDDKITGLSGTDEIVVEGRSWGTWFTNGVRDLPTSTTETEEVSEELKLYPNPVKDYVDVIYENEQNKIVEVEIFDNSGRRVFAEQKNSSELNAYRISTAELPSGFYVLSLRSADTLITQKFVKE